MLDLEFLQGDKALKQVTTYTHATTLFLARVESRIIAHAKQKGYNLIEVTPENILAEMNSPSLFGEKFFIVKLSEFEPSHQKIVETVMTQLVEKRSQSKMYFRIPLAYQELLKDHPAYIGLLKLSTHIDQVTSSKGNLKKVVEYFSKDSGYNITPSNPDVMQKALENLLTQDETYQKPDGLELLWKKLDFLFCLCFKGTEFDLISYNHYLKKEVEQIGYFRIHEVLANLCMSKKETKDHAILQVVIEVDSMLYQNDLDSRQSLSRILYAIKDLLLINGTLGCISENSSHMSKFKRQKLMPLGSIEPTLLIRLQTLLIIQEPLLRNSPNLALDLQIHVLERFFSI